MGDVSVTFRHLEATAALREYAVEKASKIRNYFGEPNEITIVLSSEKHRYTAEITLKAGRITANAKEETEDLYSAVDIAVDKVDRQIKKHKDKLKHHKQGSMPQEITSRYNILVSINTGMNAAERAPSPKRRRKRFGMVNATKKADATSEVPKK